MDILIRKPKTEDLAHLVEIYNHAILNTTVTFDTEPKPPQHFSSYVPGDEQYRMLVAVQVPKCDSSRSEQIVGYTGTYPFKPRAAYSRSAEVMLYIHPDWQRKGIGSLLLDRLDKKDFLDGLAATIAIMNKNIPHVHRLYERYGYQYKGELTDVGIKFGQVQSVVIYQLQLDRL